MSLIYVVLPMPELLWGINRVFKYIGFYTVGVFFSGRETKIANRNVGTGVVAVVLLTLNFFFSLHNLTTGFMWFVTAMIGVTSMILISQLINENRILQYISRISLIVLCIHSPVYRIVVKIVLIPLHMGTDDVRENFLLAMIVVLATVLICSVVYKLVVRIAPWMAGTKIIIGENSLLSNNIEIHSTDYHYIFDVEGKRTNPDANTSIGKHVWIGLGVKVLKCSSIADDTIV